MPKLTKRVIDAAEPGATDYFIWCDEMPGFGVRIYPSGRRGYLVQYRAGGRSRRAKIGLHGRLTVDEARVEAKALLAAVAKGGDPAEDRATQRASMTVTDLCERYSAAVTAGHVLGKRGGPKRPLTVESDLGRIKRHIVPLLGKRLVRELTPVEIGKFIRDVTDGKTAGTHESTTLRGKSIVRGGRGVATRSAGLLGGILAFAVGQGVIPSNPALGIRKPGYERRTARLAPDSYAALGKALKAAADEGVNAKGIAAIRLLALTGCRRNEILELKWPEVDEPGKAFRLKHSKEGASVRPAGAAVFAVLHGIERAAGSQWVLPGERRDLPYGGLRGAWRTVMKKAGLEAVTPHTLRHSFASVAGDMGYSESTIAAMLGHAAGSVTGRYTHHLDEVLVAAADKVAERIAGLMASE